jgi:hypothetical protein
MSEFRETLAFCNLHDLGYRGTPWTLDNKKEGKKNVKVRLDRAVASPSWNSKFPNAIVRHLVSSCSDHCPILIDLERSNVQAQLKRPWRYEMMWEREGSLAVEIEKSWNKGTRAANLQHICTKLSTMRDDLNVWKNNNFGSVDREIKNLKRELEVLLYRNDSAMFFRVKEIHRRLDELLLREELMWKQRFRTDWLRAGD